MLRSSIMVRILNINNIRSLHVERRIADKGLVLPTPAVPKGSFVNYRKAGGLIFLSGHLPQIPTKPLGTFVVGKVGTTISIDEAKQAAGILYSGTLIHSMFNFVP